jgi:hypothetical protein
MWILVCLSFFAVSAVVLLINMLNSKEEKDYERDL